jgi:hypothetical protein
MSSEKPPDTSTTPPALYLQDTAWLTASDALLADARRTRHLYDSPQPARKRISLRWLVFD